LFKLEQKHWRIISRRFWGTVFALLIALAVCVQLGRQAFPLLKDYKDEIAGYFGKRLGMIIELDSVNSDWSGLRPKLSLKNVVIKSRDGRTVFKIRDAVAELSIITSILDRRFSWRQLVFDGFETALVQDEDGKWSIPGMPQFSEDAAEGSRIRVDNLYDVFIFGRRIKITQAKFALEHYQGKSSAIVIPNISIENDRDFHRILASLDVGSVDKTMSLVVEGHGDPRGENFLANGYFELKGFPTQNMIGVIAMPGLQVGEDGHMTNLRLWFRSDATKGVTLQGEISTQGELNVTSGEYRLPRRVEAKITGKMNREKGWQLSLKDFQSHWKEISSPIVNFTAYGNFRGVSGIRLQEIDIKPWTDLALHVGLNSIVEKYLKTINPRGTLKDLDIAFKDKEDGYLAITANVEKGESEAIMGAPALGNVNGFLSMNLLGGSFDIAVDDGLMVALPKVYYDPLYFEQASGQIRWEIDLEKKFTYISSGLLTVTNPEEQGKGFLHLSLPFSKKYGEQMMTLSLGIENTLAKNHRKYVPKTIPKHLYRWLNTSIKQGHIKNARFLYHGSVDAGPAVQPTIQLSGEIHDGGLVFDPQWPKLEGVTGSLTLENNSLDVRIDKASISGNSVYDTKIRLVDDKTMHGQALSIAGSLAGDVKAAMVLLKNSPIKKHIGSTFDTWDTSGGVSAKIDLLIPLNPESEGLSQRVDVGFSKAQVKIPNLKLSIDDIAGKLYFHSDKGIFTSNLSGTIWDKKFSSTIKSPLNNQGGRDTIISFVGNLEIEDLYKWTERPELRFTQGESQVEGHLFIPGEFAEKPFEIDVISSLQGVKINLPEPFHKDFEEKTSFSARIRFFDTDEEYQFNLTDSHRFTFLSAADNSVSAKIEINTVDNSPDTFDPIEKTDGFDISGHLRHFNLEQWIAVKDQYFSYVDEMGSNEGVSDQVAARYDVQIDKFLLGTVEIRDLEISGKRQTPFWLMNVKSELLAGRVVVPVDDRPIALDLDYLRIDGEPVGSSSEGETRSVLADIDLSRIVALDFSTEEFSLGDTNFGAWDFKLRPIQGGIVIHDIYAVTKGMRIGNDDVGAEFVWLKDGEQQSSQFSGVVAADNLADVFGAWGKQKLLESESAFIDIDAQWPGAPDEVTLQTVTGIISLDVRNGSFNRVAGSDENDLLRLIALFNFDTILRRLRLDFSDLTAQGYAYDSVQGNLDFRDGIIYLTDPLIVKSSSSNMQLAGTVDVIKEKLDGEMVVTLPVASNIAVATALVVGLPAALGVYVMSKLFKKQVDRASSLNVQVKGGWEDPKVKVKKIFDIDAANRRGKEIKHKAAQENSDTTATP